VRLELRLDERGHMDRLNLGKIADAVLGTKGGELTYRLAVSAAGIRIPDMRAEEVTQPAA